MERPPKQFEFWPKKITLEELNEELRKAGERGRRKGEDLVSKEETTKVLEEKEAKQAEKIFSPKESAKKIREIGEELEKKEKEKNGKNMKQEKS